MKRKSNERKPPDLRRHLNKGKIDVNQIKEEYKLGKPLIETLTIEVDRNEKSADVEVGLINFLLIILGVGTWTCVSTLNCLF